MLKNILLFLLVILQIHTIQAASNSSSSSFAFGDIPIITNVTTSNDTIINGYLWIVNITVHTKSPSGYLQFSFGPQGGAPYIGGGGFYGYENISSNYFFTLVFNITQWMDNGTYVLSQLTAQNDAGYFSIPFKDILLVVGNINMNASDIPTLQVAISTSGGLDNSNTWYISKGGTLNMQVTAASISPVYFAGFSIFNTATSVYVTGGGGAYLFTPGPANNTWQTTISIIYSQFAAAGIYEITGFYVINEAQHMSNVAISNLFFKVNATLLSQPPQLIDAVSVVGADGNVVLTVRASSFAPINFLYYILSFAPTSQILSGGGGYSPFTKEGIVSSFWDFTTIILISKYRPPGIYNISNIMVMNDASQTSVEQIYTTFVHSTDYVADIPYLYNVTILARGRYNDTGNFWVTMAIVASSNVSIEYITAQLIISNDFPTYNITEILLGNGNVSLYNNQPGIFQYIFTYNTTMNPGLICGPPYIINHLNSTTNGTTNSTTNSTTNGTTPYYNSTSYSGSIICIVPPKTGNININGKIQEVHYCFSFTIQQFRVGNEGLKESNEWPPIEVGYTNCEKGSIEIDQIIKNDSPAINPTVWLCLLNFILLLYCTFKLN